MNARQLQNLFFATLFSIIAVLSIFLLHDFIGVLALSATLAIVFHPLHKRVKQAVRWESVAALITTAIIILIIIAPFLLLGAQLVREVQALYQELDLSSSNVARQVEFLSEEFGLPRAPNLQDVNQSLRSIAAWIGENLGAFFSSAVQVILSIFLSLLGVYYLLKDGPRLKQYLVKISPLRDRYDALIYTRLHQAVSSVVKGSLGIAILQGLATGLGFWLFGVPHAVLWGTFGVISALVPNLGTALVIVPATLYLFFTGEAVAALGLLIWGTLAVGLIDNLLGPKLMQRGGLPLHPYLILLSVIGAIPVFGPVGFLIGPLTITLLLTLLDLHQDVLLRKNS